MRIAIIGQAAFGEAVFKRLRADGEEIVAVSAPPPKGDRADPLWAAAAAAGVPVIATADLKGEDGLARWQAARPDLCAMAFVTEILPDAVFAAPRLGAIQYHPSLLPLHRGSSAIAWAIINGDTETGITIFWPDKGIDTGPVLLQTRFPIGRDETVGSLYFDRLFPAGVDGMAEAVRLVAAGRAPRLDQDHAAATYEPPVGEAHAELRWHEPAARLYALLRGCSPQPGAWTMFNGSKLKIFDARLTGTTEPGMPGRVLRIVEDGFDVRLNGGVLRVLRVQPEGGKKMPAAEWAGAIGLAAGTRLR